MSFSIIGRATVRYQEPVYDARGNQTGSTTKQATVQGSDFEHTSGEGTFEDEDGNLKHSGIWIAFPTPDHTITINVTAYRRGQHHEWEVRSNDCTIVEDELSYKF